MWRKCTKMEFWMSRLFIFRAAVEQKGHYAHSFSQQTSTFFPPCIAVLVIPWPPPRVRIYSFQKKRITGVDQCHHTFSLLIIAHHPLRHPPISSCIFLPFPLPSLPVCIDSMVTGIVRSVREERDNWMALFPKILAQQKSKLRRIGH